MRVILEGTTMSFRTLVFYSQNFRSFSNCVAYLFFRFSPLDLENRFNRQLLESNIDVRENQNEEDILSSKNQ